MNPYEPPETFEPPKTSTKKKPLKQTDGDRSFAMYLVIFVAMALVIRLSSLLFP